MTIVDEVRALKDTTRELGDQVEANRSQLARHDEQISGDRGMNAALNALAGEVQSLRKAAYWLAALIIASSIGFGFSVLTVFHP